MIVTVSWRTWSASISDLFHACEYGDSLTGQPTFGRLDRKDEWLAIRLEDLDWLHRRQHRRRTPPGRVSAAKCRGVPLHSPEKEDGTRG